MRRHQHRLVALVREYLFHNPPTGEDDMKLRRRRLPEAPKARLVVDGEEVEPREMHPGALTPAEREAREIAASQRQALEQSAPWRTAGNVAEAMRRRREEAVTDEDVEIACRAFAEEAGWPLEPTEELRDRVRAALEAVITPEPFDE